MSKVRYLVDHDFNEHIVRGVLRREPLVEFVLCRDVGLEKTTDTEILQFAAENQLVVLSHDVNTMSAAANERINVSKPMNGLLLAHQNSTMGPIIDGLILIWAASEVEEWMDEVRFLPL